MNRTLTLDDLIAVIGESQGISQKKLITEHTALEHDLGITGDDGIELLEDIEKQFSLSFACQDGTIRDVFGLKDGQYLFHSEGGTPFDLLLSLFGVDTEKVKPITVGQLYEAAVKAKNRANGG
jgi:hypothetical protein